jgi:glycerophosphoryl diester phosphodiesterase
MDKILKIGHRGAKGYVAENTLDSFQKALEIGVDGIELDVHLSKDNILVVIHDESIDRTTSGKGFVNNFTASQLEKFGIPSLKQVFYLINKCCFINIELKDENAKKYILSFIDNQINDYGWSYNLIQLSSFNWDILEFIFNKNNKIRIGVLTENNFDEAISFAKKINAYSINPYFELINEENVYRCRQKNYKIFPWTVNNNSDIKKIKDFNIDGIISDFPDKVDVDQNIITFTSKKETEIENLDQQSIIWKLKRYNGTQNSIDFFEYAPSDSLNLQFTKYKISFLLNSKSFLFDFEYHPKEEDQLILYFKNEHFKYLSFIYKNEKWTDYFHSYEIVTTEIGNGIVEMSK